MMWSKVLTLASFFLWSSVNSKGYNGCVSRFWTYHDHTHSCVKLVLSYKSWLEAQKDCRTIKGGTKRNIPGRLAKVDDQKTHVFVKGLLNSSHEGWIGLYFHSYHYRWDGYEDQKTTYTNSAFTSSPWTQPGVVMATDGKFRAASTYEYFYYLCQHDARIEKTQISCSAAPIEERAKLFGMVTVQFDFNHWDVIDWYIDSGDEAVVHCYRSSNTCESKNDGYASTVTDDRLTALSLTGLQQERPGSKFTFAIYRKNNRDWINLDQEYCTGLLIYAKPNPPTCSVNLLSSEIKVTCQTDRVFPKAAWNWSYKNADDISFSPVDQSQINPQQDTPFTDSQNGNLYYKSKCSVTLTPDKTIIKTGRLTVRIHVYPNVFENSLSQTPEAMDMEETIVDIVAPEKPKFWSSKKLTPSSKSFPVLAGYALTLECRINSGTPEVMSTHVACEFPFLESGGNTTWIQGTSLSKTLEVNPAMAGKTCRCWGQHITGDTENAILTMSLKTPATVHTFSANDQSQVVDVDLNTQVTMLCQTAGRPKPLTTLLRKNSDKAFTELESSEGEKVERKFQAKCSHSGKYFCRAQNTINGAEQAERKELSLRVKCPPTICEQEGHNPEKIARVGGQYQLSMCIDGYPIPDLTKRKLQKESEDKTWSDVNLPSEAITFVTDGHVFQRVTINFGQLKSSQLGQYRVLYGDGDVSGLPFRLSAPDESGGINTNTGVAVGVTLTGLIIVAIIVIVIIIFIRRRKSARSKEKDGLHPHSNLGQDTASEAYATPNELQMHDNMNVYNDVQELPRDTNNLYAQGEGTYFNVTYKPGESAASAPPQRNEDGLLYTQLDFGQGKADSLPTQNTSSKPNVKQQLQAATEYVDISAVGTQQAKSN